MNPLNGLFNQIDPRDAVLYQLMLSMKGRIDSDDYFSDIPSFTEDTGDLISFIARATGLQEGQEGRVGTCVVVCMPEAGVQLHELASPPMDLAPWVLVLENPNINRIAYNDNGTNKPAMVTARRIVRLFNNWQQGGLVNNVSAQDKAIRPVPTNLAPVGVGVYFQTTEVEQQITKVSTPVISLDDADNVTLTCATPGAQIYYTIDGSYPSKRSRPYSDPFAVSGNCTVILAAAYLPGAIASDCSRAVATEVSS